MVPPERMANVQRHCPFYIHVKNWIEKPLRSNGIRDLSRLDSVCLASTCQSGRRRGYLMAVTTPVKSRSSRSLTDRRSDDAALLWSPATRQSNARRIHDRRRRSAWWRRRADRCVTERASSDRSVTGKRVNHRRSSAHRPAVNDDNRRNETTIVRRIDEPVRTRIGREDRAVVARVDVRCIAAEWITPCIEHLTRRCRGGCRCGRTFVDVNDIRLSSNS